MIIDSLNEFAASGDVIDLKAGGDAIGNELYFTVIGTGDFTLTTGDTAAAATTTLLTGTASGMFSARIPMGLKRYVKATFTGKAHLGYAPQHSYKQAGL